VTPANTAHARARAVLRARLARLRQHPESGTAAVELTLLAPLFILLMLLIVAFGRATSAHLLAEDAAHAAARAATAATSPAAAQTAAASAAADSLAHAGVTCQSFAVDAQVGSLTPGSTVQVRVSCTVDLANLAGISLPGASTQTATFISVVDRYRNSGIQQGGHG
jgi:Flp pilus assembly protein TadG